MVREINTTELKRALDNSELFALYDARSQEDFEAGHIDGAESLPAGDVRSTEKLPDELDARIVFYCADYD